MSPAQAMSAARDRRAEMMARGDMNIRGPGEVCMVCIGCEGWRLDRVVLCSD